jgi:hypothetical protein
MTLLDRVHRLLSAQQVGHALVGAAALAARGVARSTYDIDLLTTDRRVLDRPFWRELEEAGVGLEIRHADADDPLGGVVRLESPGQRPVDVIVGKLAWQSRAVARAEPLMNGPSVVTAVDLVLLKLYAGGAQDLWDIRELLSVQASEKLQNAIGEEMVEQPQRMRDLWAEARRVA